LHGQNKNIFTSFFFFFFFFFFFVFLQKLGQWEVLDDVRP